MFAAAENGALIARRVLIPGNGKFDRPGDITLDETQADGQEQVSCHGENQWRGQPQIMPSMVLMRRAMLSIELCCVIGGLGDCW